MLLNYIYVKITGFEWPLVILFGIVGVCGFIGLIGLWVDMIEELKHKDSKKERKTQKIKSCPNPQCGCTNLPLDAEYCPMCGQKL